MNEDVINLILACITLLIITGVLNYFGYLY